MTSITLIESHKLFRNSLLSLIQSFDGCDIIESAANIDYFYNKKKVTQCDIVLISVYDLSSNYSEAIQKTRASFPTSKIAIIADNVSYTTFLDLVEMDVYALFSTNSSASELEKLLSEFDKYDISKEIKIDSATRDYLRSKRSSRVQEFVSFTPRELEVLNLVCQERTNVEISETLGVSIRTIESFRRKMILKVGCKNMIGVIIRALELKEFRLSV